MAVGINTTDGKDLDERYPRSVNGATPNADTGNIALSKIVAGSNELVVNSDGTAKFKGKQVFYGTVGTTDLTPGSSALDTGTVHLVYE